MFRGLLVLATVLENAQSQVDVTALEEMSINYHVVQATRHPNFPDPIQSITTAPLPDNFPEEHGSIALHVRNVQFKVDSHKSFPTPFALGPVQLSGMNLHEELHINGAVGQASFHLASPIVNMCFRLDGLPPVAQMMQGPINQHLQQAEQMGPQVHLVPITLDGEEDKGAPTGEVVLTQSSHPAFVHYPIDQSDRQIVGMINPPIDQSVLDHIGLKFDGYTNSVGSQFEERACEIESHRSSQTLLAAASPEVQEYVLHRIVEHQNRLQRVLDISSIHVNLMPLEIADLMAPCTNEEELSQAPGKGLSTMQVAAFTLCSFAMGVAFTFAAIRKKSVAADDYHQVVA